MFRKNVFRLAVAIGLVLTFIVVGAAIAGNLSKGVPDEKVRPATRVGNTRHSLDDEYTQLRYIKTTDYGATWSALTQAGNLTTFAPTTDALPEFSATVTATNELCYVVILLNAQTPGVYSLTGPNFTPVLIMAQGDITFDVGYSGSGMTDVGRCANGDLIAIMWGTNGAGENTLWAAKSTNNGTSWGTPWVAGNEALIGALNAADYSHMFRISDMNSNTTAFVIFQQTGTDGYDQFVLRIPTAGGMGTVTTIPEYAGHPFSYIFTACKPIQYDPTANTLFICFYNHDRTGGFVYMSTNGGQSFTFQTNTGIAGTRYPSVALRPEPPSGTPFLLMNQTTTMPVGGRQCTWFSYDELGYGGGSWTPPDSLTCVTRDDFSSTGGIMYVNQAYFWDDVHGVSAHNRWDEPGSGERLATTKTVNGGNDWTDFTDRWHYLQDTLDAATMQNADLSGGTNGVAYVFTAAKKGITDLDALVVNGMALLGDYMSTGPYAVKAFYSDNVGVDVSGPFGPWVNWSDPQVNEGAENYTLSDSVHITDAATNSGWYYFTIPDTNDAGEHWAVGDTIDFYCDGYDVSGLYGTVDWDQFIIVGQAYLGAEEPNVPAVSDFRLLGNYPNPFNPTTQIRFSLPADLRVTLKIYNTLGQEVATLAEGRMMPRGLHGVTFNASSLSSGVYFYTLEAGSFRASQKMVLMK